MISQLLIIDISRPWLGGDELGGPLAWHVSHQSSRVGHCSGGLEITGAREEKILGHMALVLAFALALAVTWTCCSPMREQGRAAATNMCVSFTRDADHVWAAWHQDLGSKRRPKRAPKRASGQAVAGPPMLQLT